jgi:hypothetical protein
MMSFKLVVALTSWIICNRIAVAEDLRVSIFARDPGVARWTWFQILGPRNHPFPIVYLSTQPFMTKQNEFLIVLPAKRYDIFFEDTQVRISRADCPGAEPRGNVWYTVEVVQHDKNGTQRCILPQASACYYLSSVVRLSGVNWSATELRPITGFMSEIECGTRSTGEGS